MAGDVQKPREQANVLLRSFLDAQDTAQEQGALDELLSNHAKPVIRNIARSKLCATASRNSAQDREDVQNEVVLHLLTRLRDLKANPGAAPIENFESYVATVTYNCYHEYLRQKHPERLRLKNRVRYALNHNADLALWESSGGEWLCGRTAWKGFNGSTTNQERPRTIASELENFERLALSGKNGRNKDLADLLAAIFAWVQCPVEFDELVTIVAELYGIRDELKPTELPAHASSSADISLHDAARLARFL